MVQCHCQDQVRKPNSKYGFRNYHRRLLGGVRNNTPHGPLAGRPIPPYLRAIMVDLSSLKHTKLAKDTMDECGAPCDSAIMVSRLLHWCTALVVTLTPLTQPMSPIPNQANTDVPDAHPSRSGATKKRDPQGTPKGGWEWRCGSYGRL